MIEITADNCRWPRPPDQRPERLVGVSRAEVVEALFDSMPRLRVQVVADGGDLVHLFAPTLSGRLIVVRLDRLSRLDKWCMRFARQVSQAELEFWIREQQS